MLTVLLKCYMGIFPLIFKEDLIREASFSCKNSGVAKEEMSEAGARLFNIPPRSPDLSPIIFFHLIYWKLGNDAL